ncbi:unnamed protein product [Vitrella brassicaformis CCMP3155]|uniref:Calcium-channel protein CCH1 n=6 Tax=Vitrella brassicaformis TaxID=1169539 RepID=A0A0G4F2L6_VITBC|nr:unnamed protein product [Vitrella brassicaformis CCMP3155]|eukprot:CEM06448.1 unnamed protein product [Vitrella brassicaformis CCMP3155]
MEGLLPESMDKQGGKRNSSLLLEILEESLNAERGKSPKMTDAGKDGEDKGGLSLDLLEWNPMLRRKHDIAILIQQHSAQRPIEPAHALPPAEPSARQEPPTSARDVTPPKRPSSILRRDYGRSTSRLSVTFSQTSLGEGQSPKHVRPHTVDVPILEHEEEEKESHISSRAGPRANHTPVYQLHEDSVFSPMRSGQPTAADGRQNLATEFAKKNVEAVHLDAPDPHPGSPLSPLPIGRAPPPPPAELTKAVPEASVPRHVWMRELLTRSHSMLEVYKAAGVTPHGRYATTALCGLTPKNPVRAFFIQMVSNPWFDRVVLLIIATNCVVMAMDEPQAPPSRKKFLAEVDSIFLYLFTVEMFFKIIAMGFVLGRNSYLKDPFNILDFIVVVAGWIGFFFESLSSLGFSALRTIRLLRPLRTINRFPGMRILVKSLIDSLPMLGDALILFAFVIVLYGIVGVQLYAGALRRQCFCEPSVAEGLPPGESPPLNASSAGNILVDYEGIGICEQQEGTDRFVLMEGEDAAFCHPDGPHSFQRCPDGTRCLQKGENPNYGVTSFDHLPAAMFLVFQVITLEGWSPIMYDMRKTNPRGIVNDLYFASLIILGSFFMINLVVAVLVSNFDRTSDEIADGDAASATSGQSPKRKNRSYGRATINFNELSLSRFRRLLYRVQAHGLFVGFITLLIIVNTVVLAIDHYDPTKSDTSGMDADLQKLLDTFNYVFTFVFFGEMAIKLTGLGCRAYFADGFNTFDFIIVWISIGEITVLNYVPFSILPDKNGVFTALRTFRLLRVLRLARSWKGLRKVLVTVMASLGEIANLGLLMFLFMFVFTLLGMAIYGGKWLKDDWSDDPSDEEELIRPNFKNFLNSFTTVFILLTGEDWNSVAYVGIETKSWVSALYFVSVVILGNYILLNLFLAILIKHFESSTGGPKEMSSGATSSEALPGPSPMPPAAVKTPSNLLRKLTTQTLGLLRSATGSFARQPSGVSGSTVIKTQGPVGDALFCLKPEHPLRVWAWNVVKHPFFDSFIYGLIAVGAVGLAMDKPGLSPGSDTKDILFALDVVLTVFFTLEAFMKILVYGFVRERTAYLRDAWNVLDFFIVITSVINIAFTLDPKSSDLNLSWLKSLRAMRALRPLRMVSRNEGMKAAVNSILRAIPAIADVLIVSMLFLFIFGILGVQFFKGKLYQCSDPTIKTADECVGEFQVREGPTGDIVTREREWERLDHSFDNVFLAMLTLFEMSTMEQWPDIMFLCTDTKAPRKALEYDASPTAVVYFMIFIFVMSFFILNLFVGIVIDKFSDIRNEMNGLSFLSPKQLEWVQTQRMLIKIRPKVLLRRPKSGLRRFLLHWVSRPEFEIAVLVCIILNAIVLAIGFWEAPKALSDFQNIANNCFLAVFGCEVLMKIIAFKPRIYFQDPWNVFDFATVMLPMLGIIIKESNAVELGFDTTILRILRIARLFRLIKSLRQLRNLFQTLLSSLPSLVNVGALLLLLFYVYAVAGMALFGRLPQEGNKELNEDANFSTFYYAMMTLFRMATGEAWNDLMHDCFTRKDCNAFDGKADCGSTTFAIIYFSSFTLLGSFMFINLFIAVILENFSDIADDRLNFRLLSEMDMDRYISAWARLCPNAEVWLPTHKLPLLLAELEPPLGFKGEVFAAGTLLQIIANLGVKDHGGRVHFMEVLWSLASCVSGADMRQVADCEALRLINKNITRVLPFPQRKPDEKKYTMYSAAQVAAALKVQALWKGARKRKKFRKLIELAMAQKRALENYNRANGEKAVGDIPALRAASPSSPEHKAVDVLASPAFVREGIDNYIDMAEQTPITSPRGYSGQHPHPPASRGDTDDDLQMSADSTQEFAERDQMTGRPAVTRMVRSMPTHQRSIPSDSPVSDQPHRRSVPVFETHCSSRDTSASPLPQGRAGHGGPERPPDIHIDTGPRGGCPRGCDVQESGRRAGGNGDMTVREVTCGCCFVHRTTDRNT